MCAHIHIDSCMHLNMVCVYIYVCFLARMHMHSIFMYVCAFMCVCACLRVPGRAFAHLQKSLRAMIKVSALWGVSAPFCTDV